MGDRANIAVLPSHVEAPPVVLYGHWSGSTYVDDARRALAKRWRWDDDAYLARIIFDEFVRDHGTETGYGITAGWLCDNEHPILHVCTRTQRVWLARDLTPVVGPEGGLGFEDFVGGASPREVGR